MIMKIFKEIKNWIKDNDITKIEIIFSVIIFSVMIILGLFISNKIEDSLIQQKEIYNKAIKIDSKELFLYGMKTNVGNALIYGDLVTVDAVADKYISGKYMSIKKVTEEYVRHTRTVSNGKTTRTEVYYEWEEKDTKYNTSKYVKFLDVEFPISKINIPEYHYKKTVNKNVKLRYKYYVVDSNYTGTLFTNLSDNTISDNSLFLKNRNIESSINYLESGHDLALVIFWVCWIGITVALVVLFCLLKNKWLNN